MDSPFQRAEDNFATLALHAGYDPDDMTHMPIVCPLVMTSTYQHYKPGKYDKYYYGRIGNPNRRNLEKTLAAIENAKYATTYPSGMGAVAAIASIFFPGDHFVISNDIYGGTMKYFTKRAPRQGFNVDCADFTNLDKFESKMKPLTKMIWFESPTNPMLNVVDIKSICKIAKSIAKDVVIVIDNTFLTAYYQKPLELGVDISMYSLAKYINGHSDVIMGAAVTNSEKLYKELEEMQSVCGMVPSPFDCYQVTRGLKTLAVRMEQHAKNSLKIARYLETNPYVTKVNHPGLESHPSHKLALRQSQGHSGIMSFCIKGGLPEVEKFIDNLKMIQLAPSLGGVETLVASPALMTHDMISQEKRQTMGITDSLVRLSVGIESAADLIVDLEQALKTVYL